MGAVKLVRTIDPYIIHYPSSISWQMGPGTFFDRLGQMGPMALLAYLVTRVAAGRRFFADAGCWGRRRCSSTGCTSSCVTACCSSACMAT